MSNDPPKCSACGAVTGQVFWIFTHWICQRCVEVRPLTTKSPDFYKSSDTSTIGIVCPDCPTPENLVHSICIEGMDIIQTLDVGRVQWQAWVKHRVEVHGEFVGDRRPDRHLGAIEP